MRSRPNIQQIPIPGNPGREVIDRFIGRPTYPLPDDDYDEDDDDDDDMDIEDDWDELDPYDDDDDDDEDPEYVL